MAIARILEWENHGADFQVGIEILKFYNPNHPLLPILSKENSFTGPKLKSILFEISDSTKNPLELKAAKIANAQKPVLAQQMKVKTLETKDLHPHLIKLKQEHIQPLYRQRGILHSTLRHAESDTEESLSLARQIMAVRKNLTPLLKRIDHWIEKGELSEIDKEELSQTTFGLYKETVLKINTANQYLSRNKKDAIKCSSKRNELNELLTTLSELEEKLHSCGII